jgi:hypothetical protein
MAFPAASQPPGFRSDRVKKEDVERAWRRFSSTCLLSLVMVGGFCLAVAVMVAIGSSALKINKSIGTFPGAGAGSPMAYILVVTGVIACFLVPQSVRYWHNYRSLRDAKSRQDAAHGH